MTLACYQGEYGQSTGLMVLGHKGEVVLDWSSVIVLLQTSPLVCKAWPLPTAIRDSSNKCWKWSSRGLISKDF